MDGKHESNSNPEQSDTRTGWENVAAMADEQQGLQDKQEISDESGFDSNGIHKETGTRYDLDGYDVDGFDEDGVDREGFDRNGLGTDYRDRRGFDSNGIHKETGTKFDPEGFDKDGCDKDGYYKDGYNGRGRDREGYDREGFDVLGVDREGYNSSGFNKDGFNREGKNIRELSKYDEHGFDSKGRHFFTGMRWDLHGFDAKGKYGGKSSRSDTSHLDLRGFDIDGNNHFTNSNLDWRGFDIDRINVETGKKYDKYGFDAEGFYYDTTPRENDWNSKYRTDKNGIDCLGFSEHSDINSRTGTKYDEYGFNKDGYNESGFDRYGRDMDGFDKNGIDKDGYDRDGFNGDGIDRKGFGRDGYNENGIDKDGYNRAGLDKNGYTREYNAKFNKYGLDKDGYKKNGKMDPDVEFAINFAKSGVRSQSVFAAEKEMDEKDVRDRIALARKKCSNIDEIIKDFLLTGNKMRVAAISDECDKVIEGKLSMKEFWDKHPRLNISELLTSFIGDSNRRKQFSDKTIEGLVLDSDNIEENLRVFGTSKYDVLGALKGIEDFKKIYVRFNTDGTPEQIQKKRENTQKIFETMKYLNRYKNHNLDSLLGYRQSLDGGKTWIEFNGETIGRAMDALKESKKLICVQTVKDYIINQSKK